MSKSRVTAGCGTSATSTRSVARSLNPAIVTPARRHGCAGTAISHRGTSARTRSGGAHVGILQAHRPSRREILKATSADATSLTQVVGLDPHRAIVAAPLVGILDGGNKVQQ